MTTGRRVRTLALAAALLAGGLGLVLPATGAAAAGADVTFDGEAGTLAGVSQSAGASVSSAAARHGAGGLVLSATAAPGYARWGTDVVPQGHAYASVRAWIRVLSRGTGESVDLLTVGNALQTQNFDFFVSSVTGRFQWDLFHDDTDRSDFVVEYGRWYLVEAQVDFAGPEYSAQVRIDGADQGTITTTNTATTVRMLNVGANLDKTHAQHYDDLALRVGDAPLGWLPGAAPGVSVVSPSDGATFGQGQAVAADYACSDGDLAITSCTGTVADGALLDTGTLGAHTFTVTATDGTGATTTVTRSYTVRDAGPPTVTLTEPGDGAVYARDAVVAADYACADSVALAAGNGCVGTAADGAALDTSTLGARDFTVTATDAAGNTTSVTHRYTVTDQTAPSVAVAAPADGAVVPQGSTVVADYSCADEPGGSGLALTAGCAGPVAHGAALDTGELGDHTFTVTATDAAGNTTSRTSAYRVVDAVDPVVAMTAPADGAVFAHGTPVTARYSCSDDNALAAGGGCVGSAPDGDAVDTATVGPHTFTVTATDASGRTTTRTSTYTVVPSRPDALLRPPGTTRFVGDGVYSASATGQSRQATATPRRAATYRVRIQNDASARDRYAVRGPASDGRWTVTYFSGTVNVTGAVTAGTYVVGEVDPGASITLRVVVKPTNRARRGERRSVLVTVSAALGPQDAVAAVTRRA